MDIKSVNAMYINYSHGAKDRNLEFQLTKADFVFLIQQSCIYCNVKENIKITRGISKNNYMGIDRIDNRIGYVWENCVPCCKKCNENKSACSIDMIRKIFEWVNNGK